MDPTKEARIPATQPELTGTSDMRGSHSLEAARGTDEIEPPRARAPGSVARVASALALATGALAAGALAIGALAIGALAIRRLAIRGLAIGRDTFSGSRSTSSRSAAS
jgi:hypothetical protein